MNKLTQFSKLVLCGALVEAVVGCSQPVRFAPSALEQSSLSDNAFGTTPVIPEVEIPEVPKVDPFNPYKHMTDVADGDDSMTPNLATVWQCCGMLAGFALIFFLGGCVRFARTP